MILFSRKTVKGGSDNMVVARLHHIVKAFEDERCRLDDLAPGRAWNGTSVLSQVHVIKSGIPRI